MKIKLKNIPEGFEIKNGRLIKKMAEGGTVNNTLQPVPRDEANVEAEKNETVLTDADQDGFYELYNIGGKRHSNGGTPLNLPEQSFIYSDTRKMKFTKEELKELGVPSSKRLTPAAVSKKFPINKYMEVLKDPSSDDIAIQSAEAMIKKNKIKLSQIAFMQERKKDFEEGLPLAAYPYLLENGIDPKEFEMKIEQAKQSEQKMAQGMQEGMPTHTMPDGTVHPGATHEEYMAMQQGQGMPPQGMMPPMSQMGMAMGGMELRDFIYSKEGKEVPTNKGFQALPPAVQKNIIDNMQNGGQPSIIPADMMKQYNAWRTKNRLKDIPEIQMMFLNTMETGAPIMPGHSDMFKSTPNTTNKMAVGTLPGWKETLKGFIPDDYDYVVDDPMQGMKDFINYINPFEEGGSYSGPKGEAAYLARKDAAIKKAMAEEQDGGDPNAMTQDQQQIQALVNAQKELSQQREMIMMAYQQNPEQFSTPEAQAGLEERLMMLDQNLAQVQSQLQMLTEKEFLESTMIPLSEFVGETNVPANLNDPNYQYFNPELMMAKEGKELPTYQGGNGEDSMFPNSFYYGDDNDGYPISLDPYFRNSPTGRFLPQEPGPNGGFSVVELGKENPNFDPEFESSVDRGIDAHQNFYEIMLQDNFSGVRDAWIQAYKDLDDPNKITGKSERELYKAFNDMNILFNAAYSSGVSFKDADITAQLKRNAERLGMPVPTEETIKMYQGMYNALATVKETGTEEQKNLLKQVNVNYSDNTGGAYEIVPNSGKFVSKIDGKVGDNTSQQFVSVTDAERRETTTVEYECDEETKKAKIQECMEKGLPFEEATCECAKVPETIPPGEIPPYLTFPGDDMKVGALAALTMQRDKKYGRMQNYDPLMRDPGYVDDRAAVAAQTALANQAMAVSRDPSQVQGAAQDQIDKIQANRFATNTKIFDNTQAYNVAEENKARLMNDQFMSDYMDMVNTVDQEYDNVKAQDMMNLVDAEITRMDNADKLYELNLRNPNFYFDPQQHRTIFQNAAALEAFRGNPNTQPVTLEDAIASCRKSGVPDNQLVNCAKLKMESVNNPSGVDYTRDEIANNNIEDNNQNDDNTTSGRYGGSFKYGGAVREKDLINSRIKLRNWIMGNE